MTADMAALADLISRVQVGTRVKSFGHDANTGHSSGTVTQLSDNLYGSGKAGFIRTLDKSVSSQGRRFTSGYMTWPVEGDDFEVEGDTLKIFNPSHDYTGGRAIVLEITFITPAN